MLNKFTDYYFWFAQPSTILDQVDKNLFYLFVGLIGLAIIFLIVGRFAKNPVDKSLFTKLWRFAVWTGISGLAWFAVRYENTPIFGRRYWAGLVLVSGVIWLLWIIKFLIFSYRSEKTEFDKEMIKNKYLPKAR